MRYNPTRQTLKAHAQIIQFDDINKRFADYVRGKRFALVGKGARKEIVQGDYIDSFDVVARIHWPIPYHDRILPGTLSEDEPRIRWDPPPFVPLEWQPILGKKTHIFYTSIVGGGKRWRAAIIEAFKADGGEFVVESHPGVYERAVTHRLAKSCSARQMTRDTYDVLGRELGSQAYGGTLAIFDICSHSVREVYLTGFPCFISDETPDGMTEAKPNAYTVPLNDFRWIHNLVQNNQGRITIDSYMADMFEKYD